MSEKKTDPQATDNEEQAVEPGAAPDAPRGVEQPAQGPNRLPEHRESSSTEEADAVLPEAMASGEFPLKRRERSPLDQAQDLIYSAWETGSRARRIKLARDALRISADCADAYVLLAQHLAETQAEVRAFLEEGTRAGERALGPEIFKEHKGHFWLILETRPYMRARAGLAEVLMELGEYQQAVGHYQELLRLNPNDNQGLRYLLVNLLLEIGDDGAVATLLKKYKNDSSATWHYARALLAFRQGGDSEHAHRLLRKAVSFNPYVPDYLLGRTRFPKQLPAYISPGQEDEAISYALLAQAGWRKTPGALDWLRGVAAR